MLYTQEQVEELNYNQCKAAIKVIHKMYNLDRSLSDPEHFARVWPEIDQITNTILWLEDRIKTFEDPRITSVSIEPLPPKEPKPRAEKSGRPARKFRIGDTIYNTLQEAAKITGIKPATLKAYVSRKPDRYEYIN